MRFEPEISIADENDDTFAPQESLVLTDDPAAEFLSGEDWVRVAVRAKLSTRELMVAILIFEGRTRMQIARRLRCALGTVRVYIDRLFAKLNVQDRVGLVLRIVRIHLLAPDPAEDA